MKTFKQFIKEQSDHSTEDEEGHSIPSPGGKFKWNRVQGDPHEYSRSSTTTINTPFGNARVSKDAAVAYKGFFNDMHKAGAPIKKLGSHNIRRKNSAGPGHSPGSGWSQHSYGNAVDIDDTTHLTPEFQAWRKQNPGVFTANREKWGMKFPKGDEPHMEFGGSISQHAWDEIQDRLRKRKKQPEQSTELTPVTPDKPNPGPAISTSQPQNQQKPVEEPKEVKPSVIPAESPNVASGPEENKPKSEPVKADSTSGTRWADVRAKAGYSARQSVTSDPGLLSLYNKWKEKQVQEKFEMFIRKKYR